MFIGSLPRSYDFRLFLRLVAMENVRKKCSVIRACEHSPAIGVARAWKVHLIFVVHGGNCCLVRYGIYAETNDNYSVLEID